MTSPAQMYLSQYTNNDPQLLTAAIDWLTTTDQFFLILVNLDLSLTDDGEDYCTAQINAVEKAYCTAIKNALPY